MRSVLSLSVLLSAFALAACAYSPGSRGPEEPTYCPAPPMEGEVPQANLPQHGDPYFETNIGRYDLIRDR